MLESLSVWILKSLRIMEEDMLESMTVIQGGVEMATTKSDIGIF